MRQRRRDVGHPGIIKLTTGDHNPLTRKYLKMNKIHRIRYNHCPLCEQDELAVEVQANCSNHPSYTPRLPEVMIWLRCKHCNHSFTDGYFCPDGFEELSKHSHEYQIFSLQQFEKWRHINGRMVTTVSNLRNSYSGRWLDIGFGNGSLLLTAQEFGYSVTGIDMRNSSIEALGPYLGDIRNQDFLDIDEYHRYDVISMADVLEHVPFPKTFLDHANKLLKPDGLIFISLPNLSAPIWEIMNKNGVNPYWAEIEHFHNFSRERLISLLKDHNFEYCHYGISERYRACMEMVARKIADI